MKLKLKITWPLFFSNKPTKSLNKSMLRYELTKQDLSDHSPDDVLFDLLKITDPVDNTLILKDCTLSTWLIQRLIGRGFKKIALHSCIIIETPLSYEQPQVVHYSANSSNTFFELMFYDYPIVAVTDCEIPPETKLFQYAKKWFTSEAVSRNFTLIFDHEFHPSSTYTAYENACVMSQDGLLKPSNP